MRLRSFLLNTTVLAPISVFAGLGGATVAAAQGGIFQTPPAIDSTYFGFCDPTQAGDCGNYAEFHAADVSTGGTVVGTFVPGLGQPNQGLPQAVIWYPNSSSGAGPHTVVPLNVTAHDVADS